MDGNPAHHSRGHAERRWSVAPAYGAHKMPHDAEASFGASTGIANIYRKRLYVCLSGSLRLLGSRQAPH